MTYAGELNHLLHTSTLSPPRPLQTRLAPAGFFVRRLPSHRFRPNVQSDGHAPQIKLFSDGIREEALVVLGDRLAAAAE